PDIFRINSCSIFLTTHGVLHVNKLRSCLKSSDQIAVLICFWLVRYGWLGGKFYNKAQVISSELTPVGRLCKRSFANERGQDADPREQYSAPRAGTPARLRQNVFIHK